MSFRTIIEPFRIKAVEPIRVTTAAEREDLLRRADYNLFRIPSDSVLIDLLTDSGTGAMSAEQWASLVRGDESYAGSPSFFRLLEAVRDLFGFHEVLPVHQGRAAERILFGILGGPGRVIPGNTHFDTTRANIEASGATALDLPVQQGLDPSLVAPFKGDLDTDALAATIERVGAGHIPCVVVTVTNNALGGQPVSLANLRTVRRLCEPAGIPVMLDAARFAENAFLARERDPEIGGLSVSEVVRRYFDLCDGFLLSGKKDALCNTGGLLGLRDASLLARAQRTLIVTEGFPTYGGLAGRDLDAMAQGLRESTDETYLGYRAAVTRYLARGLEGLGVPHVRPPGLHAIYVDAGRMLSHLRADELPAHALAVELYRAAGVRSCEVGTLLRGNGHGGPELLRLAFPRRVYTQSHVDYLLEVFAELSARRTSIGGYRIAAEQPSLRHFTARLEPLSSSSRATA